MAKDGPASCLIIVPLGLDCIDQYRRILLEEIATYEKNELLLQVGLPGAVSVQAGVAPGMNRLDILEILSQAGIRLRFLLFGREHIPQISPLLFRYFCQITLHRSGWNEAADVPELAEVRATLVRGVFTPQEFAGHLVIEADHVSFDESLVSLQHCYRVLGDISHTRQQQLLRAISQRLIHGLVKLGGSHDRFQPVLPTQRAVDAQASLHPGRYRFSRVESIEQRRSHLSKVDGQLFCFLHVRGIEEPLNNARKLAEGTRGVTILPTR